MNWRIVIAAVLLTLGLSNLVSTESEPPRPNRPVLNLLGRLAKLGLWIMLAGEEQPRETRMAQQTVGEDGYVVLDHGRSL